jgi:hypothetical protein
VVIEECFLEMRRRRDGSRGLLDRVCMEFRRGMRLVA